MGEANAPTMTQWQDIASCPLECGRVLVWDDTLEMIFIAERSNLTDIDTIWYSEDGSWIDASHWRPLPPPPTKDKP